MRPLRLLLLFAATLAVSFVHALAPVDGLAVISAQALPVEARHTLALIERGGPFPYRKDGSVFQNRERRLPRQPGSYYREYTVPTPGSRDRGARRIVAGQGGERYYTADHYRSFKRIQSVP